MAQKLEQTKELIDVLSGKPWEGDPLDVGHLLQQAREAYARGEWAQDDS